MSRDGGDGGPAFPRTYKEGMTLRDYFAGQALSSTNADDFESVFSLARWSYKVADAMLVERAK